ncbi:MAG: hypothetical protein JJT96_13970, partial [Opitutales bacterium]|nr:hypothetical protein [Opitutales bacterium]
GMRPLRRDQRTAAASAATQEKAMPGEGLEEAEESGLRSKIRAFSESWVVGSVAWVESFCAPHGWLGFRRERKPKPLVANDSADFATVATLLKRH